MFIHAILGLIFGDLAIQVLSFPKKKIFSFFPLRTWFQLSLSLLNHQEEVILFYPLFSIVTSAVFAMNTFYNSSFLELWYWQVFSLLLLTAAASDVLFKSVSIRLLLAISMNVFFGLGLGVFNVSFFTSLGGGLGVSGLVLMLYYMSKRRGIGEADIIFAFLIGLIYGFVSGLVVFSLACCLGLIAEMLARVLTPRSTESEQILVPLVFFIVIAIFLEEWFHTSFYLLYELMFIP